MSATLNLNEGAFSEGLDSIVIRRYLSGYQKGAVLDVTNFTPTEIKVGHIIIREIATGAFKPLPVTDGAYAALPSGHEYAGVSVTTAPAARPAVGIMYAGEVNDKCLPYDITGIKAALKIALPQLVFAHD